MVDLARQLPSETAGPNAGDVARRREHLLERRHGSVERVRREISTAIVETLGNGADGVERGLVLLVGRDLRVEHAVAAANDGAIVEAERKPQARRDVVQVVRLISRQPGQERDLLRVHAQLHVVADAQVERQPVVDLPVVLQPSGEQLLRRLVVKVGVRHRPSHAHRDRRERGEIPRRGIVPDREQLLDVGGDRHRRWPRWTRCTARTSR